MNSRKSSALSTYSHVSEGVLWGPFCEVCMHDCYRIGGFSRDFKVFHHYQNQGVPYTLSQLEAKNGCDSPFTNRDVKNGVPSPPCSSPICKVKPQLVSLTFECGTQTSIETKNQKINTEIHKGNTQNAEPVDAERLGNQEKVFGTQTFAPIPQNQQTQTAPRVLTVVPTQSIDLVVEKQKLVVAPLVHTTTIPFFKASQQIMDPIEDAQLLSMGPKWRNAVAKHLVELRQILKQMNIQVEQCIICKLAFKDAISMLGHAVSAQHLGSVTRKGYSFSKSNDMDRLEEILGKVKVTASKTDKTTEQKEKAEEIQSAEKPTATVSSTTGTQAVAVDVKTPHAPVSQPSVSQPSTTEGVTNTVRALKVPFSYAYANVSDPITTFELMNELPRWRKRLDNCKGEMNAILRKENQKIVKCVPCSVLPINELSVIDHALSKRHLNKLIDQGLRFSERYDYDRIEELLTKAENMMRAKYLGNSTKQLSTSSSLPSIAKSVSEDSVDKKTTTNAPSQYKLSSINDHPFLSGRTGIIDAIPDNQLNSVLKTLRDEMWKIGSLKINTGNIRIAYCNLCAHPLSSQFSALEHIMASKHINKVKSTGRVFSISQDQNGLHEYFKSCRERSPSVPKEEAQKDQIPAKSTDNKTDTTPKTSDPSVKDHYSHQNSVPDQGICNVTTSAEPHYDRLPEKIPVINYVDIPKTSSLAAKDIPCQPTYLPENNVNNAYLVPAAEAQSENIKVESTEKKAADIPIESATVLKELSSHLNSVPDQVVFKAPLVSVVEAQHGNALAKFVENQRTDVKTADAVIKDHKNADIQPTSNAAVKDIKTSQQTPVPVQPMYNAIPVFHYTNFPANLVSVVPKAELPQPSGAIKSQVEVVSDTSVKPMPLPMPDHFKLPWQNGLFQPDSFKIKDPRIRAQQDSHPLSAKELRDLASATTLADPMKGICKYAQSFIGCVPKCQKCQMKLECPCALFNHIFSERHIATVKKISRSELQGWLELAASSVYEAHESGICCGFDQNKVWKGIPFDSTTHTGDRNCLTADPKCVIS